MRITFTTRDSRTHSIRINSADYGLADLMGFRQFDLLFQCLLAEGGGPWIEAGWIRNWLDGLACELELQSLVLPFRYGANGDFGGGQQVFIGGERWALLLGPGQCSLSQHVTVETPSLGEEPWAYRLSKWIDLRAQKELATDTGTIKISRRKQEFRWYAELPAARKFVQGLSAKAEIRAIACYR